MGSGEIANQSYAIEWMMRASEEVHIGMWVSSPAQVGNRAKRAAA